MGSQTAVDLFPVHYGIKSELLTGAFQAFYGPAPTKPPLLPAPAQNSARPWLRTVAQASSGVSTYAPARAPSPRAPPIHWSYCCPTLGGATPILGRACSAWRRNPGLDTLAAPLPGELPPHSPSPHLPWCVTPSTHIRTWTLTASCSLDLGVGPS